MSLKCYFLCECYISDLVNVVWIVELDNYLTYFEIEGARE